MLSTPALLATLAAAICGQAFRLPPPGEKKDKAGGEAAFGVEKITKSKAEGCSSHAPDIALFRKEWERRTAEHHSYTIAENGRPLLVVGIFTTLGCQDRLYRDVLRSTWMSQKNVCPLGLSSEQQAGCSLHVTFVAGGGEGGEEPEGVENTTDMTILPVEEKMNCEKSPSWFQYASTKYPWARYIAKMDMDAFPYVNKLLLTLQKSRRTSCNNWIGGKSHTSYEVERKAAMRGAPYKFDFLTCDPRFGHKEPGCWSYMQGGFYFLSTDLARNVSKPGGWWMESAKRCYYEDALAGKAVFLYGRTEAVCVNAFKLIAGKDFWHHEGSDDSLWQNQGQYVFPK